MKINDGFILKEVAGNYIVIACGSEAVDFNNIVTVNELGSIIWKGIEAGKDKSQIIDEILKEYSGADKAQVSKDFDEFTAQLKKENIITE